MISPVIPPVFSPGSGAINNVDDILKDWTKILIEPTVTMVDAISIMTKGSLGIVIVVDNDRKLLGTLTDGDIRRS